MKKLCTILFISIICLTLTTIAKPMITNAEGEISKNPYVQAYLNEKNAASISEKKPEEYLVDPEVEEKIIIATLEEYYIEDIEVANILKNYFDDPSTELNVLAAERDGKINIMKNIKKLYFEIDNEYEQEKLRGYLERYARGCQDEISIKFLSELISQYDSISSPVEDIEKKVDVLKNDINLSNINLASYIGSYNRSAAANWAYDNAPYYSTSYPAFNNGWGNDCTNFVSQAMHVGGKMQMQGDWYCYKKNSTYLRPTSAAQLDYSWTLSDPSPWVSAKQFYSFWTSRTSTSYYSVDRYRREHESIYATPIYRGDVVIFHQGVANFVTVPTHVMIISKYDAANKDFLLAGHSNIRQAHPLLTAISGYAEIQFVKFSSN